MPRRARRCRVVCTVSSSLIQHRALSIAMAMMALVCICSNKTAVLTWHASGQVVGEDRCPIVDTYWQTETGAHVLAPIPGVWPAKPGSATLPFFGVQPAMVNEQVCTAQHSTAQHSSFLHSACWSMAVVLAACMQHMYIMLYRSAIVVVLHLCKMTANSVTGLCNQAW